MWNDNAVIIMRSSRVAGTDFFPSNPKNERKKFKLSALNQVLLKGETYINTEQNTQSTIPVGIKRI